MTTREAEKYIQLAIDAMNQSINEKRSDGKVDPKVGAVLIKPGGMVISASRKILIRPSTGSALNFCRTMV